jgi:hypothetical protein
MNDNNRALFLFAFIIALGGLLIQTKKIGPSVEITNNEIMGHIRYLSHENRSGRHPGTRGSRDVIAYLVKQLKSYGVGPGADNSFIQPFDITTGIELDGNNYALINEDTLDVEQDYIPLSFSSSGKMVGGLVFAGYGFNIDEENLKWNDYEGLDVMGKWAMVMRHGPERGNSHSPYSPHFSLHKKMLVARDEGAIGIIFISQIEDSNLYPLNYVAGYNNIGIPAIHLSNKVADKLLGGFGWSRQHLQETMNRSLESISFEIKGKTLKTNISLEHIKSRAANVIGEIRSGNREYRDEYVVIGAHFDHVGRGGPGSGSRKPEQDAIHPGADDNASGTAGLLEIAQKLAAKKSKLKRSVLLIGFDAEEKGLLGAKNFVKNPTVETDKIITMINMDMIGRMKDSSVTVGGVGTSPSFEPVLDSLGSGRNFNLSISKPGMGPSDHAAFYSDDIPVLFFFSGFHNEYHTPDDTWKHINLQGTTDIVNLVYDVAYHLARVTSPPIFSEAGPKQVGMSTGRRFKVTLGIMPSYGSIEVGVEVDGISKSDGPASRAGIKKGDVIKSIDGKPIKDIYEYMDRLDDLKKGMTVPVSLERDGEKITLDIFF